METSAELDAVIHNTSREFAAFFKISSEPYAESIEDNIEGVLSRLDELYGMLDMIRNDNNVILDEMLPVIQQNLISLQPVFERIDRLEEFVQVVKANISAVEKEVKVAEKDFGALNSIRKAVTGLPIFIFKKKNVTRIKKVPPNPPYVAPKIFSASAWIEKEENLKSDVAAVKPDLQNSQEAQNACESDFSSENYSKPDTANITTQASNDEILDAKEN